MKTKLVIVLLSSHFWVVKAQNVPEVVKKAFEKKFPTVKEVKWEKERKCYSADFKINGKEISAEFDPNGNWIQTETEIQFNEVSEKLLADVKKRYATFTLNDVELIESNKGTFYEFELSKPNNIVEALYRKNGKFISELGKSYQVNEDD